MEIWYGKRFYSHVFFISDGIGAHFAGRVAEVLLLFRLLVCSKTLLLFFTISLRQTFSKNS